MKYDYIVADSHANAINEAKRKYGDEARIITSKELKPKGLFSAFKKTQYQILVSITDEADLKNYKRKLGIECKVSENKNVKSVQNNDIIQNKNDNNQISMDSDTVKMIFDNFNKIEKQLINAQEPKVAKKHTNICEIIKILEENEFSSKFINDCVNQIETTLSLSIIDDLIELQKWCYDFIKDKIASVSGNDDVIYSKKKNVMVIIGPTGIGKTTTIAKIAANLLKNEKKNVELVTIDGFRIGAKYQLMVYAEHMKIKLNFAESNLDLEKVISLSDSEVILIDTIGRSQRDEMKLVEMKSLLKMRNINPVFVLAVSATTKAKEVEKIFKNFDIFDYSHVIITKNDESDSIGSVISEVIDRNKKLLYCTTGQRVPNDIEKASPRTMMELIRGLDSSVYLLNATY